MFERKPRSNTSSDCFFSDRYIPNDFPKGPAGGPFLAALFNLGQIAPTVKELGP